MPPLPVIADTYRVTVDWSPFQGVTPRNIFHLRSASTDVTEVADQLDEVMSSPFDVSLWAVMASGQSAPAFSILPLDGSTATVEHGFTNPPHGGAAAEIAPAVCLVMSFHTDQRGARGRGRMYIGPVREEAVGNGLFDGTVTGNAAVAWVNFHEALRAATVPLDPVVASYVHADAHSITSVRADTVAGIQRRRQQQLR